MSKLLPVWFILYLILAGVGVGIILSMAVWCVWPARWWPTRCRCYPQNKRAKGKKWKAEVDRLDRIVDQLIEYRESLIRESKRKR